jgi:hypothetical protein
MRVVLPLETSKETSTTLLSLLVTVLGITLLIVGCAASAPARQQAATNSVAAVEEECRTEPVTGSNFDRRTCRTAEEWAAIDAKQRAGAGEFGRQTRENSSVVDENSQQGPF